MMMNEIHFKSVVTFLFFFSIVSTSQGGLFDDVFEESAEPFLQEAEPEGRIETDRHDFTHTPLTVGTGVHQLEFGYMYLYKDSGEEVENTHVLPEMKLRYGITEEFEIHIRWNYAWRFIDKMAGEEEEEIEPEEADDIDGAEDLRLGFKYELGEQEGWHPESGVEVHFTVPTGGRVWSTEEVELGVGYLYQWDLSEIFSLAGSTGFATNGAGDVSLFNAQEGINDDFVVWYQSVSIGAELSEFSTGYFEWFGLYSDGLQTPFSQNYLNVGVDFFLSDDTLIDLRIGKGLSDDAEGMFVGVGGGVRY